MERHINHLKDRPWIFAAGMVASLGVYLVYVKYRLSTYNPPNDTSLIFPLHRPIYSPEIEIPLYITGIMVVPAVGLLLYFSLCALLKRLSSAFSGLFGKFVEIASWTVIFAVYLLDTLLLTFILFETHLVSDRLVNYLHKEGTYLHFQGFSLLQYFFVTLALAAFLYLWFKPGKKIEKLEGLRLFRFLTDIIVLLVVVFLVSIVVTNGWGYPDYVVVPNYNPVMGPVNDVLGGKTMLININSQYGLLSIYTGALLFRFVPLTYDNYFWFNYVTMVAGYFLLYLIAKRWLGSIAVLGILLIIGHHYFGAIANILLFCQQMFFRWGWWLVMLLLIQKSYSRILGALLVGAAFYWTFDAGTYVLLAYLGAGIIMIFVEEKDWVDRLIKAAGMLGRILVALAFYAFLISIYTLYSTGRWPDWEQFFATTNQFMVGLGLLPMPLIGPYILVLGLYFIVFTYILYLSMVSKATFSAETKRDLHLISFVTLYGIFQFSYYAGRSTNSNLLMVILPFLVVFCWILKKGKNYYQKYGFNPLAGRKELMAGGFLLMFLLAFSTMTTVATLNIYNAYGKRDSFPLGFDDVARKPSISKSIDGINEYLEAKGRRREVAIVSTWDSFFLIKTKSVNMIDSNNLDYFTNMLQFRSLGEQLVSANPDVIFTDHVNNFEMVPTLLSYVKDKYHFRKNIGYLDVLERN